MSSPAATTQSVIPAPPKRPAGVAPPGPMQTAAIDPLRMLMQYWRWLAAAVVAGIVLGLGSYEVLRRIVPRFDAAITYRVYSSPDSSDDAAETAVGGAGKDEMEIFMETSVRLMRSDEILRRAIEERAVQETNWAKQFFGSDGVTFDNAEALRRLRKIVHARRIPDTTLLVLQVGTRDRLDSVVIANAISEVFLDDDRARSGGNLRALAQQFEGRVRDLRKDMEAIDQKSEALLNREKLTALRQESTVWFNQVQNIQPKLVEVNERISQASEQLATYERMLANEGGPVYPEAIRNEVEQGGLVQGQDQAIANLSATLRAMRQRYGENHREVKRIEQQIDALKEERKAIIEERMKVVFGATIENYRNSVDSFRAAANEMQEKLEFARQKLADSTVQLQQYDLMQAEREQKMRIISETETQLGNLRILIDRGQRVRPLSSAVAPDELGFPKRLPVMALCLVLCVGLVGGVAALREIREQRVRGPHDIALIPRTRVLGVIPEMSLDPSSPERVECACRDNPHGVIAEQVRQVRTALLREINQRGHKSVLFVSGLPGAGTSAILSNLGIQAASTDLRVLLIDANLRRPSLHNVFGVHDSPGLSEVLVGTTSLAHAVQASGVANLSLLSAGKKAPHVLEKFATATMGRMIQDARAAFDLVLIDAPPAVVAGDALALAAHCDASVLVVRAMSEKRGLVARLRHQFGDAHAEFLGVIVNAVRHSAGGYFKRNIRVAHEYGREEIVPVGEPSSNGTAAVIHHEQPKDSAQA